MRGHCYKLEFARSRVELRRIFFQSESCTSWNKLSANVVNVSTVNTFKNRLDRGWDNNRRAELLVRQQQVHAQELLFEWLVSSPSEIIAAYVFAQYFYLSWLVYAVKVAGTVVHLVFAGLRLLEGYGAPAGGCRANPLS